MDASNEKQAALTELIRSEGWDVLRNEILEPLRQQLWSQLREISVKGPVTPEMGAEIAAQVRILDKFLGMIEDFVGE